MDNHRNNLGEQIRDAVQDAVTSQDFSKLNETVSQSIDLAVDNIQKSIKQVADNAKTAQDNQRRTEREYRQKMGMPQQYQVNREEGRKTFNQQWVNQSYQKKQAQDTAVRLPQGLYASVSPVKAMGYVMAITGGVFTTSLMVSTLITALASMVPGAQLAGAIVTQLLFLVLSAGLLFTGVKRIGMARRFQRYTRIIGQRSYCDIKELAQKTGKAASYVVKQIRQMLRKGWFYQGQLDDKATCLMVTDEAYRQYVEAQKQLEIRQREEKMIQQKQKTTDKSITPQVQAILDEGNAYIRKIHESNDAIPGEEISAKISHMELIVQKIFQRVEEHPEVIDELKQLMDYYLPTTVKLLDAYEDLNRQPVQGENIRSSKKEIEDTLDTLNKAFEKLLDSIFKDVAWDVSTDISVLHTILAQEGLTEDEFNLIK